MDPLSVITGVGGIVICCKNITCSLAMFVNDVRNHDVTVESFRTEVSSLEVLLLTIDDRLKAYPANTGDANAPLWSSIKGSLDDCEVTLKRLDSELDRIKQKKVRSQNMWQKPYSVLRLNMSADTIKTIRSQIHTHVGALQMSLSCISV